MLKSIIGKFWSIIDTGLIVSTRGRSDRLLRFLEVGLEIEIFFKLQQAIL